MEQGLFNLEVERILELQFSRISVSEFWSRIIRFVELISFKSDKRFLDFLSKLSKWEVVTNSDSLSGKPVILGDNVRPCM